MTVIIQLNKSEDLKLLKPLLAMFQEAGVSVQVLPEVAAKDDKPATLSKKKLSKLSDKLHGVLQLPAGFDYKNLLSEALLQKYSPLNG